MSTNRQRQIAERLRWDAIRAGRGTLDALADVPSAALRAALAADVSGTVGEEFALLRELRERGEALPW